MVYLAHARINEVGNVAGGIPGDQSGKEVCVQEFFEDDWDFVFRAKDKAKAEKIARMSILICENDNIGYDQPDRYGMYMAAKENGWQFDKINKKVSTDCSQMQATQLIANGYKVSPYMYTGNERGQIMATGGFYEIPYQEGMEFERGDILLTIRKGHTANVCQVDDEPNHLPLWVGECYGEAYVPVYSEPNEKAPRCSWPTLAAGNLFDVCDEKDDWYYIRIAEVNFGWIKKVYVLRKTPEFVGIVTSDVYVRTNPGGSYKKLGVLKKGDVVEICDTKKASNGADWYYVKNQAEYGYGFSSARYIKIVE